MRLGPRAFSRDCTEDSDNSLSSDERLACIRGIARKSEFLSSQVISESTALDAENSGSLSHTDHLGKAPLEVLVGRWPTSLIESWESPLFSR